MSYRIPDVKAFVEAVRAGNESQLRDFIECRTDGNVPKTYGYREMWIFDLFKWALPPIPADAQTKILADLLRRVEALEADGAEKKAGWFSKGKSDAVGQGVVPQT